jgi:hypothetical protein
MGMSQRVRIVLLLFLVVLGAALVTAWMTWPHIEKWAVGYHQQRVTHYLAASGAEYACITNDASAIRAVEGARHIGSFYVPGPRYRGPSAIEAALERQRSQSIEHITASLERYTGLRYGTNVEHWTEWAENRKISEPGGAAGESKLDRSETN